MLPLIYSHITLSMNTYIDPEETLSVTGGNERIYVSIAKAIEVWNHYIEAYRVATGEYWIENVNELMVLNYSTSIIAGSITLRSVPISFATGFTVADSLPSISEESETVLHQKLSGGSVEVWENAYSDALNKAQVHRGKDAILQINIALENLINTYARVLLESKMGLEETNSFLEGRPKYSSFFLKEDISKRRFDELVETKVIKSSPPTVFAVVKQCAKYWDIETNAREVNSLVSKIRRYRNSIIHGNEVPADYEEVANAAIQAFEQLQHRLLGDDHKAN